MAPVQFSERYGPWAVVTGASAGIGAAFAEALAQRGLSVALVARRRERLAAAAERLQGRHGVPCLPVALDLTLPEAVDRLRQELGGRAVGLLVNNAGFGGAGRFLEQDPELLRRMVRLNCEVPVALAAAFLPAMAQHRRGGMIVVASVAGYLPTPWMSVYGATKAFDLMLGEALAVEMSEHGVDVAVLAPGSTATEFHDIAGIKDPAGPGGLADPARIVDGVLQLLGRRRSHVPGLFNRLTAFAPRLLPRKLMGAVSGAALRRRLIDEAG